MSMPLEAQTIDRGTIETSEMKQPLQYHDVDETMSEWELARLTSKTWSMGQD